MLLRPFCLEEPNSQSTDKHVDNDNNDGGSMAEQFEC